MPTLNDSDILAIKDLLSVIFDEKIEEKGLATKEDIKQLLTREEFCAWEDRLLTEVKSLREKIKTL